MLIIDVARMKSHSMECYISEIITTSKEKCEVIKKNKKRREGGIISKAEHLLNTQMLKTSTLKVIILMVKK